MRGEGRVEFLALTVASYIFDNYIIWTVISFHLRKFTVILMGQLKFGILKDILVCGGSLAIFCFFTNLLAFSCLGSLHCMGA